MELRVLRSRRKSTFWGQIIPYLPYVFQSGVAVVLLILCIVFSAWYTSFLQALPPDLPVRWIMLLLLGPLTVYSGFRTYVQPADVVFLLPQESKMQQYLSPAYFSGVIYKLLGLFLIAVTAWPMYARSGAAAVPLWALLLVLLLLKVLSAYGAWQEIRISTSRARMGYRLLRWCFILLMLAAWIWLPDWWKSLLFMLLLGANYVLALRFPMKHAVPWENLIANEKAGAARTMMILGWFVEIPAEGQKVVRRRWLSMAGNRIPWKPGTSYRYLLTKTFVRSELLGIVTRLTLLGLLIVYWTGHSWIGAAVYLFFIFIIGTQLSALRYVHRDSPAASYYPIMQGVRMKEVLRLITRLLFVLAVILWLPLLAAAAGSGSNLLITLGGLAAGMLLVLLLRANWTRKWSSLEEDE
ncbi:ABC transporter permease [Paenibacillus woosongensis]|uniref:Protein EcsB n=1 Tax=Paenibacillus woosongensis TaxID=307580 RepID=A0ABQ4MNR4_9BACL|nr:ABC transporter permease [Paenibacillus woosongensis]GIP57327.1 protein EcsB [Paenibacillus woosongensis]